MNIEVVWDGTRAAGLNPSLHTVGQIHRPAVIAQKKTIGRYDTRARVLEQFAIGPATVSELAAALKVKKAADYQRIATMVGYLRKTHVLRAKREIRVSPVSKHAYRCFVYRIAGGSR